MAEDLAVASSVSFLSLSLCAYHYVLLSHTHIPWHMTCRILLPLPDYKVLFSEYQRTI